MGAIPIVGQGINGWTPEDEHASGWQGADWTGAGGLPLGHWTLDDWQEAAEAIRMMVAAGVARTA